MDRKLAFAGMASSLLTAAVAAGPSAQAAESVARNGSCDPGEFCLYYNSDHQGSVSDFSGTTSILDYGATQPDCYEFKGAGAGQGQCVKNNAASVWNRTAGSVTVYYNSSYGGSSQTFTSGSKINLNSTLKNENASHRVGTTAATKTNLSFALYKASGGWISCGFDGYRTTSGRHEGIDIKKGIGEPVYALVSGRVTRVHAGQLGRASSSSVSLIAIYNATQNKTVIYLHTAPSTSLYAGQNISKGQRIGVESWRGVSTSGSFHTHVEMRPGYQTHASVSVGDLKLDNPDPTTFWNYNGYKIG